VDLQVTSDGSAMVYHDNTLGRLTESNAQIRQLTMTELRRVPFKSTADRMLTLVELCDLVAGRATLLLELKSHSDGDERLARHVADVVSSYSGPLAAMSFDPAQVRMLRDFAPALRRGLVAPAEKRGSDAWAGLPPFLNSPPQFLAYAVRDLPATAPLLAKLFGMPILSWTVRSDEDQRRAARWADQIIFEGFRP